jgi:hypothetical protein
VLKMDVEESEWGVVRNIMEGNLLPRISQLALEWHIFPNTPRNNYTAYYDVYRSLQAEAGFRKYCG